MPDIQKPEIKAGLNSFSYWWEDLNIRVNVNRLDEDGKGEVSVWYENGDERRLLLMKNANLLSSTACSTLCKQLVKHLELDWDTVLTYVTALTMDALRQGEPVRKVGIQPADSTIQYILSPLLEENQPTTIYGPGSSAKSYFADYIACLVQFGEFGLNGLLVPEVGNVLYLDWETCFEDHQRRVWFIKRGLGIETEECFFYRFCAQSLSNDIYSIQKIVTDEKIALVIVDSQMAAANNGPDQAANANQYYNALRSLRCTTLTIDHVNKVDWKGSEQQESTGPYGSVVKYNRSRAQFEIKKSQGAGEQTVELSIIHRKNNNGRLLKPFGVRLKFIDNQMNHLDNVVFESCDVTDNPELAKTLSIPDRILAILKASREPMTAQSIGERMEKDTASIRVRLNELKTRNIVSSREVGKDVFWAMVYHE